MNQQLADKPVKPTNQIASLTLGTMYRALRRHPVILLMAVIAGVGVGAATYVFLPPLKPVAYAIFRIQAQPDVFMRPTGDARYEFNIYRQAQTNLVKNRLVLNNAISQPEVKDSATLRAQADQITWLETQLQVDFKAGPEMMKVSMQGENMDEMKAIITAVTSSYLKEVQTKDKSERFTEYSRKKASLEKYQASLQTKRKAIMDLAKELTTSNPDVAGQIEKVLQERIGQYKHELGRLELDVVLARKDIDFLNERIATAKNLPIPDVKVDAVLKQMPDYQLLVQKQRAAQKLFADDKANFTEKGSKPNLAVLEGNVKDATEKIKEFEIAVRPAIIEDLRNQSIAKDKQRVEELQQMLDINALHEKAVDERLRKFVAEDVKPFKTNQLALEQLKQDVAQTEKITDRIQADVESIKPDLDSPVRVDLWQEPIAQASPEGNRRVKYGVIAGIAVFTIGLALVVGVDHRYRRVTHAEEVIAGLGLRVVGTVPAMPKNVLNANPNSKSGKTAIDWHEHLSATMDSTRTLLLHSLENKQAIRTILITSALSGEGKTSLSSHLAVSLARAGYKTLLVDADMRRPMLHHVVGVPLNPGLSELLRNEATLGEVIRSTQAPFLSIIPAGLFHPSLPQILAGNTWRELKTRLETDYDYVIVDTPPLLPVADALLLARHVDGVLLALLSDVSRLGAVAEARDRLTAVGTNILGVVVNGVSNLHYGNSYDYYYYHTNKA